MGGGRLAAAADDGGTHADPLQREIGIAFGGHFRAGMQAVHGRIVLQELLGDLLEPVGIGPVGKAEGPQTRQRRCHRLGRGAVGQNRPRLARDDGAEVCHRLARPQARPVLIIDRHRQPDRLAAEKRALKNRPRMGERGHRLGQEKINHRRKKTGDFGIFRHGFVMRRMRLRPVGGDERPQRSGNAPRPMRGPRGGGFGQRLHVQRVETVVDVELRQPVVMDGIGVRRGHRGTGVEIVLMHLPDEAGMVDHHLRGPQGRRRVAGARHKLLPHATVEKRDVCHVFPPYQRPACGRPSSMS